MPTFAAKPLILALVLFAAVVAVAAGRKPSQHGVVARDAHSDHILVKDAPVLTRASYNYAPAVIHDGDTYHLYWCAGVAGDYVLHAQATSLDGPWAGASGGAYDEALKPTGSKSTFDGTHTCDPNVLKVGGRFYLYYGGLTEKTDDVTAIGVAASMDGAHFARLNAGKPIVVAAKTNTAWQRSKLTYGAGQPAAAYLAPWIYLAFTDSTGAGANPFNGAGQFVLRSKDPSFATGVQEFVGPRWEDRPMGVHTASRSVLEAFGIDWAYDRDTDTLVTVADRTVGETTLFALDPKTFRTMATGRVALDWQEGPALLAAADKTMPPRPACATLDATVFAAAGRPNDPGSWHALQYSSGPFAMGGLCARRAADDAVSPAPARTPPARDGAAARAR